MRQIDIEKCIRTRKLKFNLSLTNYLRRLTDRTFFFLFGAAIIYFFIRDIWDGFVSDNLPIGRIIVWLLFVSFASWIIYGVFNVDRLTVILGTEKEKNKELMNDLLTQMFSDTQFSYIDDLLIGIRPWTMRIPGKEINVIYKDSEIYINITHKVRFGKMDSLFHVLANEADIKEIRKTFLEKISS